MHPLPFPLEPFPCRNHQGVTSLCSFWIMWVISFLYFGAYGRSRARDHLMFQSFQFNHSKILLFSPSFFGLDFGVHLQCWLSDIVWFHWSSRASLEWCWLLFCFFFFKPFVYFLCARGVSPFLCFRPLGKSSIWPKQRLSDPRSMAIYFNSSATNRPPDILERSDI